MAPIRSIRPAVQVRIDAAKDQLKLHRRMTVRQIFYQLVHLGWSYKQVQYATKVGRLCGLIPPSSIVDRSRPSYGLDVWENVRMVLGYFSRNFKLDYWQDTPYKLEVWSEKDALSVILNEIAQKYRVPVRVTRGFLSISKRNSWSNEALRILYVGDHDPSGLVMDKDLQESPFLEYSHFKRVALTMDQIEEYKLPSVPVKKTDPRSKGYLREYGSEAWEVDALDPMVLKQTLKNAIEKHLPFNLESKRKEEMRIRNFFLELGRTLDE